MAEIRCIECGASVEVAARACPTCGNSLSDERRALYDRGAIGSIAAGGAPAPVPTVEADGMGAPSVDPQLLPTEPLTVAPDPFIGPITRRTVRYLFSQTTISVRAGLIAKRTTTVETWRIGSAGADIVVTEGPLQRLRGTGTIRIEVPSDPDTPVLVLRDVPAPHVMRARILASARVEQIRRNRFQASLGE